jgi:hypothetical protein
MKTFLLTFLLLLSTNLLAQSTPTRLLQKADLKFFIENKGQWNPEVKYLARIGGMNAWITNDGVVYEYYKTEKNYDETKLRKMPEHEKEIYKREHTSIIGHVIKTTFAKNNSNKQFNGEEKQTAYYNYFIGNKQSKWVSYVSLYGSVTVKELYDGIDVKYYFDGELLRYDFIVKPNADVSQINLTIEGAESFTVSENDELEIETSLGKVIHKDITAYQKNTEKTKLKVAASFVKKGNNAVGLAVENYNKNRALIIDPLVYSTFIGGNDEDYANSIALDNNGNAYLVGCTNSTDFPVTDGAYQTNIAGLGEVFITKLDATGGSLEYSTFLGGAGWDEGNSLTLDDNDNAYIIGDTQSDDFPTTDGAYQSARTGDQEVFIAKLNENGDVLKYSTFLGGSVYDYGASIAVDDYENAYISGQTNSVDFPLTDGAYQTTLKGLSDAFIAKLDLNGENLIYSTYLGGENSDASYSIAVDANMNAYLTGQTSSEDFPATDGVYQTNNNGNNDVFVAKFDATGNNLVYSTYIGGSLSDYGKSIAVDADGNGYVAGYTRSVNFPTTDGAYQTFLGGGGYDAIVFKLDENGESLCYSTYLGGSNDDRSFSLSFDDSGNACIIGETKSSDFPVTDGAFQTNYVGDWDVFIAKFDENGETLDYSTFFGGSGEDRGTSIAFESGTYAYITGYTSSDDFPTTDGAFQTDDEGDFTAFVAKINMPLTSAAEDEGNMPESFKLFQNYPNPFSKESGGNPATKIKYFVPENSFVKLEIFNVLGERVALLVNAEVNAGYEKLNWNASDLPSGIYLIRMEARGLETRKNYYDVKKALLIK